MLNIFQEFSDPPCHSLSYLRWEQEKSSGGLCWMFFIRSFFSISPLSAFACLSCIFQQRNPCLSHYCRDKDLWWGMLLLPMYPGIFKTLQSRNTAVLPEGNISFCILLCRRTTNNWICYCRHSVESRRGAEVIHHTASPKGCSEIYKNNTTPENFDI